MYTLTMETQRIGLFARIVFLQTGEILDGSEFGG